MYRIMNLLVGIGALALFPASLQAQDATAGKTKYDTLCVTCHGATGAGDGVAAQALNPKPKDLTVTIRTDEELKKIIKEGGTSVGLSPLMVAWGSSLTDEEITNVVAYIRTLKK